LRACSHWVIAPPNVLLANHEVRSSMKKSVFFRLLIGMFTGGLICGSWVSGCYAQDATAATPGITINRWGHGYACGGNDLYDPRVSGAEPPYWVRGRRRFGRIAIANSDAAGVSLTQAAVDQANRAVRELIVDVVRPQVLLVES
jgi:hypothetical protein